MSLAIQKNNQSTHNFMRFMAWAVLAILVTLIAAGQVHAADILKAGDTTVKETFGTGSTFAKWLILGEVIFGVFSYIKTKNLLLLGGVVVVIVFTTIGFNLAA
ncbi:type IV conjugative transfer system pilin TraA [Aeromonas salmonicida]|uniref:type IV conjugative transfer system pilin TraA n=1 Tax=Aeromonas salmonicida TaxID=645 RepID=UPI000B3F7F02|nr:type IV conjugative transfer system pilin TraA [Aeromonas salmonicida]ARW85418.1 hypothetical protein O23A_P4p0050 [Aeromonas salmonicida]